VAAFESRLHPGDLAPIGLQHTNLIVGQARAWSLTAWATTSVLGRFPPGHPSLDHPRGQKVAGFDAVLFQFQKRHRSPIRMDASTQNLLNFCGDLLEAFPLACGQTHSLNLHVEGSLPDSFPDRRSFSPPAPPNAMPTANREVRSTHYPAFERLDPARRED
jgi:hypothetical protein